MIRFFRSAFVIARRDFSATVLSKTFIFFLLAPLFPLLFGGVFGGISSRIANRAERPVVAVAWNEADYSRLSKARDEMGEALGEGSVIQLERVEPDRNAEAQVRDLLASGKRAVLTGSRDHPHLTGPVADDRATATQLRMLIADAQSAPPEPRLEVTAVHGAPGSLSNDRAVTAQIAQTLLFILCILLSGMLLSQLIEEKSNKIIEVIAAAVPIDALFIGKLFAMLAASIVGIVVWISAGALLIQMISNGGVRALPTPAVGWPGFLALGVAYFAMYYLLLGAAFLTIGAQASTAREVQTLSMPVTFAQVLIFGFAATTVGRPDSVEAIAAAIFPLSSPMAMLARASQEPEWWPHIAAIVWQGIWVAVILRIGSRLFR
ncbi:MAG: ABC transporter permease, partial [Sphingomonas sp.]|nr:ABC transporter permease [Sphingomonas sp.]